MNCFYSCIAATLLGFGLTPARATVLTGTINAWPESVASFVWGDGVNDLSQNWSVRSANSSGWAYGSGSGASCDVFNAGRIDPKTVQNAALFTYSTVPIIFSEGDAVFFRGLNGYYGAWKISDVFPTGRTTEPIANLTGIWYFQTDGTGNFAPVPEPSVLPLLLCGGVGGLLACVRINARAHRR